VNEDLTAPRHLVGPGELSQAAIHPLQAQEVSFDRRVGGRPHLVDFRMDLQRSPPGAIASARRQLGAVRLSGLIEGCRQALKVRPQLRPQDPVVPGAMTRLDRRLISGLRRTAEMMFDPGVPPTTA